MKIQGAKVLITGATGGIGRALALELARRGAIKMALVGRRVEALAEVELAVKALGAEVLSIPADVADKASIEEAVHRATRAFGGLDIVVANAGIGIGGGQINADALTKITQVNFLGAAYTLLAAVEGMSAQGRGHLVAISSLAALRGLPIETEYSASKIALDTLLEGLRIQLAPKKIAVTIIRPSFIDTPINQHMPSRPFLITAEDAAQRIAKAIEREARISAFPQPSAAFMRLVGVLPGWLYDRIGAQILKKAATQPPQ